MQSREGEPPSLSLSLSTGDSLTKQFVNECSPGRDYVFTIVSHFTRQNRSILSLSLTRDGFCSLTELKRDGRIPTAAYERGRAGFQRAARVSGVRTARRQAERRSVGSRR